MKSAKTTRKYSRDGADFNIPEVNKSSGAVRTSVLCAVPIEDSVFTHLSTSGATKHQRPNTNQAPVYMYTESLPSLLSPSFSADVLLRGATDVFISSVYHAFDGEFSKGLSVPTSWMTSGFASSYTLLMTAQSMAVAGKGSRVRLLHLKDLALRSLSSQLSQTHGSPRLDTMATIALLSSPIVCLLSQDLPFGLSIEVYAGRVAQGTDTCCPAAVAVANNAAEERAVHWNHLTELTSKCNLSQHEPNEIAFLEYVNHYRSM